MYSRNRGDIYPVHNSEGEYIGNLHVVLTDEELEKQRIFREEFEIPLIPITNIELDGDAYVYYECLIAYIADRDADCLEKGMPGMIFMTLGKALGHRVERMNNDD